MVEMRRPAPPQDRPTASHHANHNQFTARERELDARLELYGLNVWDRARLIAEILADAEESRCPVKGCTWVGTCPVHNGRRYPRGFHATQALMACPSTGRRALRVVK